MRKISSTLKALTIAMFLIAVASITANAQATRTWVSGVGDDVNPCSRTAPCKTFAGAISKTAKDGEIDALDPGGFGTITITKSITINGTHGEGFGSILAAGTNGVVVNITDATDARKTVRLRSLDINGAATGVNGISIASTTLAGTVLIVEDTVVDGFTGNGINANFPSGGTLKVSDSTFRNCATGLRVSSTSGFGVATADNSHFDKNTNGIDIGTNGFLTVSNSTASLNSSDGLKASGGVVNAYDCVMAHNTGNGVNASSSGSTIRIASNNIYANGAQGVAIAVGATVSSDNQNRIAANNSGSTAPNGAPITVQ